jgi:hypothetical protein
LLDRSHVKWNYEVIVELIEGPLLNPKRLDETIKATKFFKRLFSFFHPYNNRFSSIKRTRVGHPLCHSPNASGRELMADVAESPLGQTWLFDHIDTTGQYGGNPVPRRGQVVEANGGLFPRARPGESPDGSVGIELTPRSMLECQRPIPSSRRTASGDP